MEYPELAWTQIQELRERLKTEDRKLVESLLDKIETLYWELEAAKLTSKIPTVIEQHAVAPLIQASPGHRDIGPCECQVCFPLERSL
jgi:hypothetical protein